MVRQVSCLLLAVVVGSSLAEALSPIIIIPGILGSKLEARVNMSTVPNPLCRKTQDWFTLWLSVELALPGWDACFANAAKLQYDPQTNTYTNNTGAEVRVPGFGNTSTVEYLAGVPWFKAVQYFNKLVDYFVQLGYERGKNIRAAPYDWRLSAAGLQETGYYEHLYSLIEETYLINNRAPVTLLAHSMGGPVSLFFLSKVAPADWKASRIKQYITLSGVFAGCVDPLKAIISGDNEGIVTASPLVIRELQRSCGSEVFLLPFPSSLWTKDDVLVVQPERNYSIYDLEALFTDLNYTNGWAMWEGVQNLVSDFPAPNVTSFCFYGTNSSTVEQLIYNTGQFPDKQPSFKYGNGDGTVNLRSLQACSQWTSRQTPQVTMRGFSGVVHTNMVEDINVLKAVQELVLS